MFKPHRFNPLLKATPNAAHEEKVSKGLVHGHTHEELTAEVDKTTTTTTTEDGKKTTTKKEVVEAEVTATTPATAHHKAQKIAEVDVEAEVTQTTTKDAAGSTVQTTEILSRVHATTEGIAGVEMTPPHPPREETPEYVKAHHHMVYELDSPCAMCGVRHSTLNDPKENPFGAKALETHHYPIERSLLDACDPAKVGVVFPQVKDQATLESFVDSEHNLMILCDIHHRHPLHGIHHLVPQDFFVQPFLLSGYQVVATQQDEAAIMAADESLIESESKPGK